MDEDILMFDEINEFKKRKKNSFQSILNQKELTADEMETLFLGEEQM